MATAMWHRAGHEIWTNGDPPARAVPLLPHMLPRPIRSPCPCRLTHSQREVAGAWQSTASSLKTPICHSPGSEPWVCFSVYRNTLTATALCPFLCLETAKGQYVQNSDSAYFHNTKQAPCRAELLSSHMSPANLAHAANFSSLLLQRANANLVG